VRSTKSIALYALVVLWLGPNPLAAAQPPPRVIHVFVALCDNASQGIVPVPARIGNGDDPKNNLYWGAAFGIKTFFEKSPDWRLITTTSQPREDVLERCIFKHKTKDVYLIADAYKGSSIKRATMDFLMASAGRNEEAMNVSAGAATISLSAGGSASLVAYIGHNGLMDFQLGSSPRRKGEGKRDAIILACLSKSYFAAALWEGGANPLLWTSGLMAPEAYTLKGAIVSQGIKALTGFDMPVFPKRRFQHGAVGAAVLRRELGGDERTYRRTFQSFYA
jgi:hypothetical protein